MRESINLNMSLNKQSACHVKSKYAVTKAGGVSGCQHEYDEHAREDWRGAGVVGSGLDPTGLEFCAGTTSGASRSTACWRGTVGLRCIDIGTSSRSCCEKGDRLLRGSTFLPLLPCARMDHKGRDVSFSRMLKKSASNTDRGA